MTISFSTALRNARMDAISAAAGANALIRIYDGTRPANGGAATTLLAELTAGAVFAAAASGGVLTAGAITQDASANNTGTASWFRLVKSDGTTQIMDGSIGTTGADLNLSSVSIVQTVAVSISSFVLTEANS